MSVCTRCGAEIRWVRTAATGARMPLDAVPIDAGHVVFDSAHRAVVLNDGDRDRAVRQGELLWRVHMASCPAYKKERGR